MPAELLLESLRTGLTPFLGLPLRTEPESAPGVVLGAPYDGGVLNRPGARFGPWAIRAATLGLGRVPMPSRLQSTEAEARPPVAEGWLDGGNIPTLPFGMEAALDAVDRAMSAWLAQGARTLMLGGDHLMTLGALRAHARRHGALGLLHLDAHPDAARGELWGTPCHHGTWLRQALAEGLVDPGRVVQVGLRAPRFDHEELAFLRAAGVRLWTPRDLRDPRLQAQLQGDIARVGQRPAYLTVDLDVLDPSCCPAVAEPVPGGLGVAEVLDLLREVRRWTAPWVGADLMELAPGPEGASTSALAAAHLALHLFR